VEVSAAQSTLSTSTPLALISRNQSLCISVHLPTSHFGIAVAFTTVETLPNGNRMLEETISMKLRGYLTKRAALAFIGSVLLT
jgi:hypothetical protein